MVHFNVELWNNHQLCVFQVFNIKETNPAIKVEKLAKAECRDIILECRDIISECRKKSSR